LSGNLIATIAKSACTYNITGSYDTKTYALTGQYKAYHGCTGQTGTFLTKEQCDYVHKNNDAEGPNIGGLKPC
jgi:hypothetical protein